MNSLRLSLVFCLLVGLLVVGCNSSAPPKSQAKAKGNKIASRLATGPKGETTKVVPQKRSQNRKQQPQGQSQQTESDFDFGANEFTFEGGSAFQGGGSFNAGRNESRPGLSSAKIVERVTALLADSIDYGPTLAVWVIDESKSSRGLVTNVANTIRQPYGNLKQDSDKFTTAVCTFGQKVRFAVDPPSSDPASFPAALDSLPADDSGQEMVFTATNEALDKYVRFRTEQQREVLFFIVTDEAGDDQQLVAGLAQQFRKNQIPVYVIGVPAPLGRDAAIAASVEVADDKTSIRQGPESRYSEHIELGFWGGMNDFRLMDSGFGPFALEQLCRTSGGRYIALRPATSGYSFSGSVSNEWPSSGVWQPEPSAMRKYAPDYVSEAEYQALLQSNAACQALHRAAQLPAVEFAQLPQTSFVKRSEAQLATDVQRAQQFAAKLGPPVQALFDALEEGEAGRDKLTSPRWKAAFDLAMGRATAARARVEGYNVMLAELKRGKNFTDESHNTWELLTAEKTEATTGLRKLCERAQGYLQGVIKEHPGTPWAKLAERELQAPLGWKWTER
jgi:hypothetical protein